MICPNCKNEIIQKKDPSKINDGRTGRVLKIKLMFLNDDGSVMGKCRSCNKLISLPINFNNNK